MPSPQRTESYDIFARFYDDVQGDRADHAAYIRQLIQRHHPNARTILELACGTGSVLRQLHPEYQVTGVDQSKTMLAVAANKVPEGRLVVADMTKVNLGERFNVVLCVYDSINHLTRFRQWQLLFERVRDHLDEGGIFIFDINTERRLDWLTEQPPTVSWFGGANLLVLDVRPSKPGVIWEIRIFERVRKDEYRLHSEAIPEVSFPLDRIKTGLEPHFRQVRIYDQQRTRPSARSGRLHFVCTR